MPPSDRADLTLSEGAKIAECHQETLRRAIATKELLARRHPTRRGRPWLIRRRDLDTFLKARAAGTN
jgi:excisionase family DNA binding protein